jgi:hypothetical protein
VVLVYQPGGQGAGHDDPIGQKYPSGHEPLQLDEPSRELKLPPEHDEQVPAAPDENCPEGHGAGTAVPEGQAKPMGHVSHASDAAAELN